MFSKNITITLFPLKYKKKDMMFDYNKD